MPRHVESLFCIHSGIIPVGQFSRICANQSINQAWTFSVNLSIDWLIEAELTLTWLVYWIRTARSVFTGAGLKWPNSTGQYSTSLVLKAHASEWFGKIVATHVVSPLSEEKEAKFQRRRHGAWWFSVSIDCLIDWPYTTASTVDYLIGCLWLLVQWLITWLMISAFTFHFSKMCFFLLRRPVENLFTFIALSAYIQETWFRSAVRSVDQTINHASNSLWPINQVINHWVNVKRPVTKQLTMQGQGPINQAINQLSKQWLQTNQSSNQPLS